MILVVNPNSIIVSEDGTGANIAVSKIGYSFGEINFVLRALTYSEYESIITDNDEALDNLFPLRPSTAADSKTHTCTTLIRNEYTYYHA